MTRLIVTGTSGQFGQRVLSHLLDTLQVPSDRIIATTRAPERLSSWAARGVDVRRADFDDPAALAAAFRGGDRLLLISTDALDRPGARLTQHLTALQAAQNAGVGHVVYTSMPVPDASIALIAPDHLGTEQALAASALPGWTVLRNHWYFENLLHALPRALQSGQWFSAAGDGGIAHIARDDLALAAATALADTFTGTRTLTLGGTRAWTTREIATLASQLSGRPLDVVPVPAQALVDGMVAAGVPQTVADVFASFDTNIAAGHLAGVTGDFQALTGRAPQAFEDWLSHHIGSMTPAPEPAPPQSTH